MNDLNPDSAEETVGSHKDDPVPTYGFRALPTVGLGGSLGSMPALQKFLQAVPADSGMAFVVVVHLSAEHDSILADILQRSTAMPVVQVTKAEKIEPDHVYVIPPGQMLQIADGELTPMRWVHEPGRRVTVDLFFRSLAEWCGPHATAIVLSGGDGDGAIGIKRIRERGGLTIAQDPGEAEAAAMPRSAIATGLVDWILPVAEMAQQLVAYRRIEPQLKLPPEAGPQPAEAPPITDSASEAALRDVLVFLHTRTGHDFSYYKRATIVRRIARRMQVNGVKDLPAYLGCLRTQPGEAGALLQDLLISVTNFFRDNHCFAALEAHLPELFSGKGGGDRVRVWVAACATGEEAYSIGMMLHEYAGTLETPPSIQVFATDLDELAIQTARTALYPTTIEADVSAERLRRFFVKEHTGYRIRRELRETVLFAQHDLLKDSPFSRVDLVSCRNLLIYLTREAQQRALGVFHFALRPGGLLFLGTSETVEDDNPLFVARDKKNRIYGHRAVGQVEVTTGGASTLQRWVSSHRPPVLAPMSAGAIFDSASSSPAPRRLDAGVSSWPQLHFELLEQLAPPSLIIDAAHQIVHLSEGAGRFLRLSGGEPTNDLLQLVHPDLRVELRAAIFRAEQTGETVEIPRTAMEVGGEVRQVSIRIAPAKQAEGGFLLVVFDDRETNARSGDLQADAAAAPAAPDPTAERLDREIGRLKGHLRETIEQYEAANEELKASNEELQAMNEELRSATEELETGREELQSINEELSTVNHELKSKVDELGSANSDMLNLMDATAIPTVFLDRELHITRYTPAAVAVFNLIPSDIGRPLTDLHTELDYPTLADDARRVLEQLIPVEREVSHAGKSWYSARLLPYRTAEDRIAGLVLTLVDITERGEAAMALRASEERLRLILESARDYAIFSCDLERRITRWNPGAERLLGYSEAEVLGKSADLIFTPEDYAAGAPVREAETALANGRAGDDRFHVRKDGSRFWASGIMMPMRDGAGTVIGFVKILRDQTEARQTQQALEQSRAELLRASHENEAARREAELQKEHLEALFSQAPAPICILRGADYRVEFANPYMHQLWGRDRDDVTGEPLFDAVPSLRATSFRRLLDKVMETGVAHTGKELPAELDRSGSGVAEEVYLNFTYAPLHDVEGRIDGVLVMAADVTDEVRAREQMSELHEMAQAAGRAKDDFLAMLGHELRNPLAPLRTSLHLIRKSMPGKAADKLLDIAERQSSNLSRIVDDLLEAARITEGKIELRIETVDLCAIVTQALEATREFLEAQRHTVTVDMPKRPLRIRADPVRVEQVAVNLLNNAGKYTPAGGNITVRVKRAGTLAELRVIDDGIGIPEDLRPRLFQIFQQGNRDLAREEGGLGVGLSVVRRLVELHNGSVEALSDGPGKGSEFVVRLPLAIDVAMVPEAAAPLPAPAPESAAHRVLVVDDNIDAGETLQMLVETLGHSARLAAEGASALRICAEWHPDVVFLDIGLPGMDGYEVAREIRLRYPDQVPYLVAVTGYGQERDRAKTREAGFDEHLVKPAGFAAIVAIMNQLDSRADGSDA